jgi:energy-coupling factor transport system ATP-binding protein
MKSKDIAVVGILLAVGAILRFFLAMLHTPLTPNMIIAFYCLAIILIRPRVYEAFGIGIIAGILSMMISSSLFPPANLISEPVGALVCFGLYAVIRNRTKLAPAITTFLTTLASGFTFAAIAIVFVSATILSNPKYHGNMMEFVIAFVPIVVITAVFNAVIVPILYIPSSRVLVRGQESSNSITSVTRILTQLPSLHSLSLFVRKGRCVMITGPSGAGKTTLCLAAAGILHHEY